jgi:hypothetical protein
MSFAFFIPYLQEKQLTKKQTQTNIQASNQPNKQKTNTQTDKQANKNTNKQTKIQTNKQNTNAQKTMAFFSQVLIHRLLTLPNGKQVFFFFEGLHSHLSDRKYSIIRQSFSFGKGKEREKTINL